MTTLYFDVTDVVDFATRYSRVTGIQRVQLNIVTLLARQHGGERVRCTYFDDAKRAMFEFDPAQLSANREFNAEALLADLGVTTGIAWLRGLSKSQVKSFLRRYNNNKGLRAAKKVEIYVSALLWPSRLSALGLLVPAGANDQAKVVLRKVTDLPAPSLYVCMGSIWKYPEVLAFAKQHSARGQGVVQMVYDLIPVVHPEYYTPAEPREYESWLEDAFGYVRSFACISQWTAADLQKFASRFKREIKTRVVPLAHEFYGFERSANVALPTELSNLDGKRFALCVGTIETRKNGVSLLKAWRELADELGDRTPLLVFAGKFGKGGEVVQKMLERDSVLARLVYLEHAPSDRQLAWLYRNCMFTVFPSTYEGWGLPVGESAWFGKYCVASHATSVPEVCGELLKYVDPTNIESIKAGISELLMDATELQTRESHIKQASLRSWASVADDMFAYLTSEAQAANLPNNEDSRV